jgi:hypothetical protein
MVLNYEITGSGDNKVIVLKCQDSSNQTQFVKAFGIQHLAPYIKKGSIDTNKQELNDLIGVKAYLTLKIITKRSNDNEIIKYMNVIACLI